MNSKIKLSVLVILGLAVLAGIFIFTSDSGSSKDENDSSDSEVEIIAENSSVSDRNTQVSNDSETSEPSTETGSTDQTQNSTEPNQTETESEVGGVFVKYSEASFEKYANQQRIIFFKADWCPTCRALEADIIENADNIPLDTVILEANYDTEADLKKQYQVRTQHTLVVVDENGEEITKGVGSNSLDEVLGLL